ncbi:hypothetical protein HMPREF1147_2289 [Selenomonas sp. FOBRC9]|nr:hypothetical protein HMPREF1147_2289 [Selenomonas sp. FOBRC9]
MKHPLRLLPDNPPIYYAPIITIFYSDVTFFIVYLKFYIAESFYFSNICISSLCFH